MSSTTAVPWLPNGTNGSPGSSNRKTVYRNDMYGDPRGYKAALLMLFSRRLYIREAVSSADGRFGTFHTGSFRLGDKPPAVSKALP
jgi:hypothetical protein